MNTTQGIFRPGDYKRYMTLDGLCAILYLELLLLLRSTQIVKTALEQSFSVGTIRCVNLSFVVLQYTLIKDVNHEE